MSKKFCSRVLLLSLFLPATANAQLNTQGPPPIEDMVPVPKSPTQEIDKIFLENFSITVPEESDFVFKFWQTRRKYFLIIAANELSAADADLPFVEVNGELLAQALIALGYEPLTQDGILADEDANLEAALDALDTIMPGEFTPESTILIYYAGHGVKDPKEEDLWLQLHGGAIGPYRGLSLSRIIDTVRGNGYSGDLAVLVDACFSGQGVFSGKLTLKDLGPGNTTILTSSSDEQSSYKTEIPGVDSSAFSYFLLRGLTEEWRGIDPDEDGLVTSGELRNFIAAGLKKLFLDKLLYGEMTPFFVSIPQEVVLAYRRDKVKNWNTPLRSLFVAVTIDLSHGGILSETVFSGVRSQVAVAQVIAGDKVLVEIPVQAKKAKLETRYIRIDPSLTDKAISIRFNDDSGKILLAKDIEPLKASVKSRPRYMGDQTTVAEPKDEVLVYTDVIRKIGAKIDVSTYGVYYPRLDTFDLSLPAPPTVSIEPPDVHD